MSGVNPNKPIVQYDQIMKAPGKALKKAKGLARPKNMLKIMKKVGKQLDRPRKAAKTSNLYTKNIEPLKTGAKSRIGKQAFKAGITNPEKFSETKAKLQEAKEEVTTAKKFGKGAAKWAGEGVLKKGSQSLEQTKKGAKHLGKKSGITDDAKFIDTKAKLTAGKKEVVKKRNQAKAEVDKKKELVKGKMKEGAKAVLKKSADAIASRTDRFDTPQTAAQKVVDKYIDSTIESFDEGLNSIRSEYRELVQEFVQDNPGLTPRETFAKFCADKNVQETVQKLQNDYQDLKADFNSTDNLDADKQLRLYPDAMGNRGSVKDAVSRDVEDLGIEPDWSKIKFSSPKMRRARRELYGTKGKSPIKDAFQMGDLGGGVEETRRLFAFEYYSFIRKSQ